MHQGELLHFFFKFYFKFNPWRAWLYTTTMVLRPPELAPIENPSPHAHRRQDGPRTTPAQAIPFSNICVKEKPSINNKDFSILSAVRFISTR